MVLWVVVGAPEGLDGRLSAGHSSVAEVDDRLVQAAAAAADDVHALRRNSQAIVKHGGASFEGRGLELEGGDRHLKRSLWAAEWRTVCLR